MGIRRITCDPGLVFLFGVGMVVGYFGETIM